MKSEWIPLETVRYCELWFLGKWLRIPFWLLMNFLSKSLLHSNRVKFRLQLKLLLVASTELYFFKVFQQLVMWCLLNSVSWSRSCVFIKTYRDSKSLIPNTLFYVIKLLHLPPLPLESEQELRSLCFFDGGNVTGENSWVAHRSWKMKQMFPNLSTFLGGHFICSHPF